MFRDYHFNNEVNPTGRTVSKANTFPKQRTYVKKREREKKHRIYFGHIQKHLTYLNHPS